MRYLLSSAVILASSLSALPTLDARLDRLEEQVNEISAQTVYGNYGAKTASAIPRLNTYGGFLSIEGLCLQFFEGGSDFVYRNTTPISTSFNMGRTKTFSFDWRFAFRVAGGYQFKCPDWTLWAEYLRFTTEQSKKISPPAGGSLSSNFVFDTNPLTSRLEMEINYNTLDLNLGRPYLLRNNFSLHPFVGVRGAVIHQHDEITETFVSSTLFHHETNRFYGAGLRAGSQARWLLGSGWSLFGSLAGSIVYGTFDNRFTQNQSIKLQSDTSGLSPNLTSDAGLSWEKALASARTRISLSLGYEFDYWWRQNQTIHNFTDATVASMRWSEDLGLHGVKLNCGFDF
ncbi:MAG TPA: Lpg1974 family pore-forming outer membrane protein [Chlamydiales bacterium]|jgi:hypothetical protein